MTEISLQPIRSLIVDDGDTIRRITEKLLKKSGHDVAAFDNPVDALKAHTQQPFDLMILDWMMPQMTGIDLCKRIRSMPGGDDVVILIFTSRDGIEDLMIALDAGASDYLIKGAGIPELTTRILVAERHVLETKRRIQAEHKLRHNALHDALTNLPNRALLIDRIEGALHRAQRNEYYDFAVLFMDLDGFKLINDSMGHDAGDILLRGISDRLSNSLRGADTFSRANAGNTVARLGGDEFVVLLENINDPEDAIHVAKRIFQSMSQPFIINSTPIFVKLSVGIVHNESHYDSAHDILRDADTALYQAKGAGRDCFKVFNHQMRQDILQRIQLESDLRLAVDENQLRVQYQPIIELQSGAIYGFEALARWDHPVRGTISPAEFIPIAEETGLIEPISNWILNHSCEQLAQWQKNFPEHQKLTMSVNLSRKQLANNNILGVLDQVMRDTKLDPKTLKLEITESIIIDDMESSKRILEQFQVRKFDIHMDDFGTGYSSLSCLHSLPIDTIKLDQAFIRDMNMDGEHASTVQAVITLAQNRGMKVIAEGVETLDQLSQLQTLDCDFAQGFHIAKPLDALDAEALLNGPQAWRQPA